MRYTTIIHEARLALGLSMNDYCIADCIYHYSNNPKSPAPGWCFASKQHIADQIGITKSWAVKSISLLEEIGLIEKSPDGRMLKTTQKWYSAVIVKDYTDGVLSTPTSVNGLHRSGVENTPPSYNKIYTESLNDEGSQEPSVQEALFTEKPETKKSKAKPTKKGADPVYRKCVDIWLKDIHPGWTFGAMHGNCIKSILKKLREISSRDMTDSDIVHLFEKMMRSLPDWLKDKEINVIDSKFNEIITEIRNGKPTPRKGPSTWDIINNL